jgi:hypothetical protein
LLLLMIACNACFMNIIARSAYVDTPSDSVQDPCQKYARREFYSRAKEIRLEAQRAEAPPMVVASAPATTAKKAPAEAVYTG